MNLSNIGIGKKLASLSIIVSMLVMSIGLTYMYSSKKIDTTNEIIKKINCSLDYFEHVRLSNLSFFVSGDEQDIKKANQKLAAQDKL